MDVNVRKPTPEQKALLESCPTWEHEPGTFPGEYDDREETCLVIEGQAYLTLPDGRKVPFGPGDLVTFAPNLVCDWTITETIKKHYIFDMDKK